MGPGAKFSSEDVQLPATTPLIDLVLTDMVLLDLAVSHDPRSELLVAHQRSLDDHLLPPGAGCRVEMSERCAGQLGVFVAYVGVQSTRRVEALRRQRDHRRVWFGPGDESGEQMESHATKDGLG